MEQGEGGVEERGREWEWGREERGRGREWRGGERMRETETEAKSLWGRKTHIYVFQTQCFCLSYVYVLHCDVLWQRANVIETSPKNNNINRFLICLASLITLTCKHVSNRNQTNRINKWLFHLNFLPKHRRLLFHFSADGQATFGDAYDKKAGGPQKLDYRGGQLDSQQAERLHPSFPPSTTQQHSRRQPIVSDVSLGLLLTAGRS